MTREKTNTENSNPDWEEDKSFQDQKRDAAIFAAELREMPMQKLQADYREEQEKSELQFEHEDGERFFSLPDAKANFAHWSKTAYWTLDEAITLSFGKEPARVQWENLQPLVGVSPFAEQYDKTRDLVLRAKKMGELTDPVDPGVFLAWAKRKGMDYPQEFESLVTDRGQAAEQQLPQEKPLQTKERESLLKLVIGMAKKGYGYDPRKKRSTTISEIESDLRQEGIALDADTIRKWLKEAVQLLPGDETD